MHRFYHIFWQDWLHTSHLHFMSFVIMATEIYVTQNRFEIFKFSLTVFN